MAMSFPRPRMSPPALRADILILNLTKTPIPQGSSTLGLKGRHQVLFELSTPSMVGSICYRGEPGKTHL